jgi:hypothetical protein
VNKNSNDEYLGSIYSLLRMSLLGVIYFLGTFLVMLIFICMRAYDAGYTVTISNIFTYLLNIDLVLFFRKAGVFILIALALVIYVKEEKIMVSESFPYSLAINALIGLAFLIANFWLVMLFANGVPQLYLFGK